MLLVPLKGDKVETKDGVVFTVLSYTNYREKGPAVYVEHTTGVPSDAVYFFDIAKVNGKAVQYVPGAKVFKSIGELKRRYHLPQVDDVVTYKDKMGTQVLKVTGLKLHRRNDLAKGMFVTGKQEGSDDTVTVRLKQVIDIERDIGNDLFSRDRFMAYYGDYVGS